MEAIGLNPIRLDAIGIDPIRLNAIRLGVPGASSGSARPYIDPEVLASLVGVWICDGKTNYDPDRNIIKNKLPGRGGDFEILNAAYKLNSGFGKYEEDFASWGSTTQNVEISNDGSKAKVLASSFNLQYTYSQISRDVSSFKVKISNFTKGIINYYYREKDGIEKEVRIAPITVANSNGVIELPKSYNTVENSTGYRGGFINIGEVDTGLTIEQLPLYEGAFVTDGKDDMIVSQKTIQEMGITNEITVVSMIHQIGKLVTNTNFPTNCIQANTGSKGCNIVNYQTSLGKTGIYGYSRANVNVANNEVVINNILGDKADYLTNVSIGALIGNEKFSVVGYLDVSPQQVTSVAAYWTFIANKVLTTDEISQIIAYYNLDKYVEPIIYYDVPKQKLTNNTPNSDWYLKDYSKNNRDMQLYNFAKKLDSGVGKYKADYSTWNNIKEIEATSNGFKIVKELSSRYWLLFLYNTIVPVHKVLISGIPEGGELRYNTHTVILKNGINELPEMKATSANGFTLNLNSSQPSDWIGLSVEQIPDYEGALCFDGVNDYGKVTGLPVLKDYTVVADYCNLSDNNAFLLSKNAGNNGAFVYNNVGTTHSFGQVNNINPKDTERKIHYQSKYINDKINISAGGFIDTDTLWLCTVKDNDSRFKSVALYSTMLFHYSLSEFLLERQLKKYKLGTLYPNMVEFRPIVKSNIEYKKVDYFIYRDNVYQRLNLGEYIFPSENVIIRVTPIRDTNIDIVSSIKINGTDLTIGIGNEYAQTEPINITKSPQKIDITIDEYIRYEDIVQPYPAIVSLRQDGKDITWGDKLKVGSEVTFVNHVNLLPERYAVSGGISYNGTMLPSWNSPIKVEKSMVFTSVHGWKLNTPEPHAIYSPQKLNIPNSSLKILGYVPDLTGKGNHGKLNNFAYTEDSGVTTDGSIKLDGVNDFITIPTLAHGGKCVMMKVNYNGSGMLYDQRKDPSNYKFGIFTGELAPAYNARNDGSTYIDGILNTNIIPSDLFGITHNITAINNEVTTDNTTSPKIGASNTNTTFSKCALYEFMLFPEIPSEDEIKKLNDIMGIEGGYVESPDYYFDSFGKSNVLADDIDNGIKNINDSRVFLFDKSTTGLTAIEQTNADGQIGRITNRALLASNFAFNEESGYGGWLGVGNLTNSLNINGNSTINNWTRGGTFIKANNKNSITGCGFALAEWFDQANHILKFKVKISGLTDSDDLRIVQYNLFPEIGQKLHNGINEVILNITDSENPEYRYISFRYPPLTNDVDFEFLYEYQNGLVSDGVEDHLINTAIPAFTDFTVIAKREFLNSTLRNNETFCLKGDKLYPSGVGNAFAMEYYYNSSNYLLSFGSLTGLPLETSKISYITPTSYNGNNAIRGNGDDNAGLMIGKCGNVYWKGVFYKMMLYTKTIDQLSINMLKNLFERDELIDVNNPIFKKEEL